MEEKLVKNREHGQARTEVTRRITAHIGGRIKLRRRFLGMTQRTLADKISMSEQQVQRYESGVNGIDSGLLAVIGNILDVPVSFFYDGFEQGQEAPLEPSDMPQGFLTPRETSIILLSREAGSGIQMGVLSLLEGLKEDREKRRAMVEQSSRKAFCNGPLEPAPFPPVEPETKPVQKASAQEPDRQRNKFPSVSSKEVVEQVRRRAKPSERRPNAVWTPSDIIQPRRAGA